MNVADVSSDLKRGELLALDKTWGLLREKEVADEVLIRCYLNGYTFGTDGYFHADSERPDEHATALFMNDYWSTPRCCKKRSINSAPCTKSKRTVQGQSKLSRFRRESE